MVGTLAVFRRPIPGGPLAIAPPHEGSTFRRGNVMKRPIIGAIVVLTLAFLVVGESRAGEPLFSAPVAFPTGPGPFAAAYADLNGDGFEDIVTANWIGSGVSVLLSTGAISFLPPDTYPAPFSVTFISIGDIDEDGDLDFMAPVYSGQQFLRFFNNGDGTFRQGSDFTISSATPLLPSSSLLADLNGDGHLDLAFTRDRDVISRNLLIFLGDGHGDFALGSQVTSSCGANRVIAADFNQDGRTDLAVSSYYSCGSAVSVHLQSNLFPGTFGSSIYPQPPGSYGIVAADFNGDGYPDLATTSDGAGSANVLLNHGDGTMGPAATYGNDRPGNDGTLSLVAADFDQDGDQDIVLANRAYDNVTPLLGNGDGTFAVGTDYFFGDGPAFLVTTDLDLDGRPDIFGPLEGSGTVAALFGNGDGSFANEPLPRVAVRPLDLVIADFDRDGDSDIVTVGNTELFFGPAATLLANQGDGTTWSRTDFLTGVQMYREIETGDVNGDGWPDLVVANLNLIQVFRNDHPGWTQTQFLSSFEPSYGFIFSLAVGDVNGDSRPDIASARIVFPPNNGTIKYVATVYLATGAGTFQAGTDYDVGKNVQFIRLVDTNRDGKLDVVVSNMGEGTVSVLQGKGDGTFKSKSNYGTGKNPHTFAVGDLNGDGRADLVVGNLGERNTAVLVGTGNGAFKSRVKYDTSPAAGSVQLADFNGDGKLDASVLSYDLDFATVILGNGDGTLGSKASFATGVNPVTSGVGDLNGDGRPDLVTGNYSNQNMGILLNTGAGGLVPAATYQAPITASLAQAFPSRPGEGVSDISITPNPINPEATFSFTVGRAGPVRIGLYDVHGRLVRTLLDRPVEAGAHQVKIDGRSSAGQTLASGVYYYRLETAGESRSGRITILK